MSTKTNRPVCFHVLRALLCMANTHRARQSEEATVYRRKVCSQDWPLNTEAGSSPEIDSHGDESIPPARILPADGYQSARQPEPHIDTLGELADATLLVPKSLTDAPRCCHRSPKNRDSGNDTRCNQNGEYEEWSVARVETHRKVRPCRICFTAQSEGTLTPERTYAGSDGPRKMCPYCSQSVPSGQHSAHTQICAEWKQEAKSV